MRPDYLPFLILGSTSLDSLIYIKAPFWRQFYIKYHFLYYRYLESEKTSFELETLDPR